MNATGGVRSLAFFVRGAVLFGAVAGFVGCGEHDEPPGMTKQAVKFEEVPENVRAAASQAIPAVKFNEAWKNLDREGKLHSYEIRGKNPADGRIREARVSESGKILEME
jgi:hypothetical protein